MSRLIIIEDTETAESLVGSSLTLKVKEKPIMILAGLNKFAMPFDFKIKSGAPVYLHFTHGDHLPTLGLTLVNAKAENGQVTLQIINWNKELVMLEPGTVIARAQLLETVKYRKDIKRGGPPITRATAQEHNTPALPEAKDEIKKPKRGRKKKKDDN